MALQADGRYAQAARVLVAADKAIETLDYVHAPIEEIADFTFAPGIRDYRATPPERVLINAQNVLNFLGAGRFEEAAVEARRARLIMLDDPDVASPFAWAVGGLAFELRKKENEAVDAYRAAGSTGLEVRATPDQATILIVVQHGRAPVRTQAVVWIPVSETLRRLNVPKVTPRFFKGPAPSLVLDGGAPIEPPVLLDVESQLLRRFEQEEPRLLAAAIAQALPRAALSDAVRRDGPDSELHELAALALEEGLGAAMPPDTRSWTLLPAEVRALRWNVAPGVHTVAVGDVRYEVEVSAGDLALVNVVTAARR